MMDPFARIATLEAECASLRDAYQDRYLAAAVLATENERLRSELARQTRLVGDLRSGR